MNIRQLNLSSAADFAQLALHIERLYAELFGARAVPSRSDLEHLRERLPADDHWAFLIEDAERAPAAFFTLAEAFAVFARGEYGIINELWVRPDVRSRGVGALALEHCRAFGKERGWKRIDVSAPASAEWDRSYEFYRRQGFELTGRKLKCVLDTD